MRDFDYIICGNNIGAIAAAMLLGKTRKVAMVNPTPNWGGIFAGIKIDGKQFDAGMAVFEYSFSGAQNENLLSYNPASYQDSARFSNRARAFFEQRLELTELRNLKTFFNGVFYEDIIMANRLEIMASFCGEQKQKIISELESTIKQHSELHAANKKKQRELFLSANYHNVSVANHGKTVHEIFIEPLCQKVHNISAQDISALYHRAAWCPLYYPETLLAAARGESVTLPEAKLHYPKAGYFAKMTETLTAEMRQTKGVTILQDNPTAIKDGESPMLYFGDNTISAKKIIWCGDLSKLSALSGTEIKDFEMQKSSIVMAFVETEKENVTASFSSAHIFDSDTSIYRITHQNAAHSELKTSKFIFEMNTDFLQQKGISEDHEIIAHIRDFCTKAKIFNAVPTSEQWTIRCFKNALTMPTTDNYKKFCSLQEIAQFRNIDCIGAAAGFIAGAINDQIVAALQLEEKYGSD